MSEPADTPTVPQSDKANSVPRILVHNSKQIHILLIDDDETLLRLFGGDLQKAGFEVLYAHDGNEGRETARRLQPDIILLDLTLPIMDGYEVTDRLKAEKPTKHIPIIILTSTDMSQESEGLLKQQGVDDYIHKSVQDEELVERVKKVLRSHGYTLKEVAQQNLV
jgi:DNA-binding response OmpR family regulator